jgi:ABC-type lipoprotein release transport system permease subunit
MEWNMAIVTFLFGSLLGITGAILQMVFGFGFAAALQTYAFCSIALPLITVLARSLRNSRNRSA